MSQSPRSALRNEADSNGLSLGRMHRMDLPHSLFCHAYGMAIRTTVDLPEPLYAQLRHRAKLTGASIRSLIVNAIEQTYPQSLKGRHVTGPMIRGSGKRGPRYPTDENPHELILP